MTDDSVSELELRTRMWEEHEESMKACVQLILEATVLTVGPGEIEEYDHVPVERRYREMAAFYYWLVCQLVFNASEYKFVDDFAESIGENLTLNLSAIDPTTLVSRYQEYNSSEEGATLAAKAKNAMSRSLQYMDPTMAIPRELADELGREAPKVMRELFRTHTSWK